MEIYESDAERECVSKSWRAMTLDSVALATQERLTRYRNAYGVAPVYLIAVRQSLKYSNTTSEYLNTTLKYLKTTLKYLKTTLK
ncbi:hypothetical protein [Nostoc favosum]|uniref:Uncharacterized protein n=1 Tax=Nostoc favosum CHAB5714 TaxID=2780399 RepID=A0ABS8I4T5_9NOSO|nr:hypothetical protein [Nostoc favosum]MCC5599213.1 hypothetical protein [Nostoc favosum CHAB5714]